MPACQAAGSQEKPGVQKRNFCFLLIESFPRFWTLSLPHLIFVILCFVACQHLISALAPCCCVILKLGVQNSTEDLTKPESAIQGGGRESEEACLVLVKRDTPERRNNVWKWTFVIWDSWVISTPVLISPLSVIVLIMLCSFIPGLNLPLYM